MVNRHVCVGPWRAIHDRRHVHGCDGVHLGLILLLDALHRLLVLQRHDDGAAIAHDPLEDPRDARNLPRLEGVGTLLRGGEAGCAT